MLIGFFYIVFLYDAVHTGYGTCGVKLKTAMN